MASFSVITDVSNALVNLLRENMVPDIIHNLDSIGLCTPADKGDIILAINLYDIKESDQVYVRGMQNVGVGKQKYPSSFIELYYMITAFSPSDIKFRAAQEQMIIGKTIQVLKDNSILTSENVGSIKSGSEMKIEMLRMTQEEKMKLWNVPNVAYKTSLFYKIQPIEIESDRVRQVSMVTDVDFGVVENK